MITALFVVLIFFSVLGSLWLRTRNFRQPAEPAEIRPSPLSLAIQELVAVAGGVYLSLIMLVSFLKIDVPTQVVVGSLSFDPLACMAIGLAVIQPIIGKLFKSE